MHALKIEICCSWRKRGAFLQTLIAPSSLREAERVVSGFDVFGGVSSRKRSDVCCTLRWRMYVCARAGFGSLYLYMFESTPRLGGDNE